MVYCWGENAAVTARPCVIETLQEVPAAVQPVHPVNWWPEAGVAVRLTLLPSGKVAEQAPLVEPAFIRQLIPAGAEATVPAPAPAPLRDSRRPGGGLKFATSVRLLSKVNVKDELVERTVVPSLQLR